MAVVRYALNRNIKAQTRIKMLKEAKRDLNKALKCGGKNVDYQVMYLRAVVNFALNYFFDAITDLE